MIWRIFAFAGLAGAVWFGALIAILGTGLAAVEGEDLRQEMAAIFIVAALLTVVAAWLVFRRSVASNRGKPD